MISKITIALHAILTLVILALTVRVLQDEQNEKKGIVPDVAGSIATAVKSAASGVVTAAVASGESLVAATLPSSVSVGTKYACVASECAAIPGSAFRLIQDLASFLPSRQEIEKLQELGFHHRFDSKLGDDCARSRAGDTLQTSKCNFSIIKIKLLTNKAT
ncbi:hypothetical protein LZ30DRAFT_693441 [Colletotrichum cereale]|nr:hypothetical protein LZ30DRAFT_693441 [Colletotrichum cereale]